MLIHKIFFISFVSPSFFFHSTIFLTVFNIIYIIIPFLFCLLLPYNRFLPAHLLIIPGSMMIIMQIILLRLDRFQLVFVLQVDLLLGKLGEAPMLLV